MSPGVQTKIVPEDDSVVVRPMAFLAILSRKEEPDALGLQATPQPFEKKLGVRLRYIHGVELIGQRDKRALRVLLLFVEKANGPLAGLAGLAA